MVRVFWVRSYTETVPVITWGVSRADASEIGRRRLSGYSSKHSSIIVIIIIIIVVVDGRLCFLPSGAPGEAQIVRF